MSFKFPYTCSKIDRVLENQEGLVKTSLEELIEDICYYIDQDKKNDLISHHSKEVLEAITEAIEEVRKINAEMRDAAEEQISDLEEELKELKSASN